MRWPDWLPWVHDDAALDDGLDFERVLTDGMRDRASAREAIATLTSERKALVRKKKSVNKSLKPITWGDKWRITQSSKNMPDLGAYQLSKAMRDADASGHTETLRKEQIAEIEGRIQEIDRAKATLDEFTRRPG